MKFMYYNINKLRERIYDKALIELCRKNKTDFTRKRKIGPIDIIMFNINNRGKTLKMEMFDFINEYNINEVSSPAMLKRREKLNENVFKELNKESLKDFYNIFRDEVKTFKGYILCAIDGSDVEVPNTPETRKRYQAKSSNNNERVARIKLSNCYDVLNKRVLDTEIEEYKHSEIDLAKKHINIVNEYTDKFHFIYTMDRGYFSLEMMYELIKNDTKFVIRLNKNYLKNEQKNMKSNDEIVEIMYQYDRIRNYKEKNPELYEFYENGNRIKVRLVNIELPTGEIETLITNLSKEEFPLESMKEIYKQRWGIEISYHKLKESMLITNISSSKDTIIKQEIYAHMMVYNIVESIAIETENQINQDDYKYKMQINFNMAIGFTKRAMIKILIEDNINKREEMMEKLCNNILKNIIPIRPNRHYDRKPDKKNKHSINKRKSF